MYIAAYQTKCRTTPSVHYLRNECTKALYIHTLEYYMTIKRNDVQKFPGGPVVRTQLPCRGKEE